MPLTREFKSTVLTRAKNDKKFCEAMLTEAINELLSGDIEAGKAMLRDYINATISFEVLAKLMEKNPKSIMRMLSVNGNPTSKSLFTMFHIIQKYKKIHFKIILN